MLYQILSLTFGYELNSSLQIGDEVYWTSASPLGGFTHNQSGVTMHIGSIITINTTTNTVQVKSHHVDVNGDLLPNIQPPLNSFISFAKNNVVNNNDLTGYYANVNFINNSTMKAELFSVGSEISESSK